uniref:Uncharacterized protein n=1 Tax=Anguilla anguilla TaxID=7936 RepID=A0A0E9WBH1_ANGAN
MYSTVLKCTLQGTFNKTRIDIFGNTFTVTCLLSNTLVLTLLLYP